MNLPRRKPTIKFYFSVEGETEKWYLEDFLQPMINDEKNCSDCNVKIKVEVEKNPSSFVKKVTLFANEDIYHLCDIEGNKEENIKTVHNVLDNLDKAKLKYNQYKWVYCNLSFELWIILHKKDLNSSYASVNNYLPEINNIFNEHFNKIEDYKKIKNFHKCLSKLNLSDVKDALTRSKLIMKNIEENNIIYSKNKYNKYEFYLHNPSLTIYEAVNTIIHKCFNKNNSFWKN